MKLARFILLSAFAAALSIPVSARFLQWTGASDSNWSTAANWDEISTDRITILASPAASAPISGDRVFLTGAGANPTNQDIADLNLEGISVNPTAAGYTVTGLAVGLLNGDNSGNRLVREVRSGLVIQAPYTSGSAIVQFPMNYADYTADITSIEAGTPFASRTSSDFPGGTTVISVNVATGEVTLSNPANTTRGGNGRAVWFGSDIELAIDLVLLADAEFETSDGLEVFEISGVIGESGGSFQLEVEAQGGTPFGNFTGAPVLTGLNTFTGPFVKTTQNNDLPIFTLENAGVPSSLGAGDTIASTGGGGELEYVGVGDASTDRTINITGGPRGVRNGAANTTVTLNGPFLVGNNADPTLQAAPNAVLVISDATNNYQETASSVNENDVINVAPDQNGTVRVSGGISTDRVLTKSGGGISFYEFDFYAPPGLPSGLGSRETVSINTGSVIYTGTTDVTITHDFSTVSNPNNPKFESGTAGVTVTLDNTIDWNLGSGRNGTFRLQGDGDIVFIGEFNTPNANQDVGLARNGGSGTLYVNTVYNAAGGISVNNGGTVVLNGVTEADIIQAASGTAGSPALTVADSSVLEVGQVVYDPDDSAPATQNQNDGPNNNNFTRIASIDNPTQITLNRNLLETIANKDLTFVGDSADGFGILGAGFGGTPGTLVVNNVINNLGDIDGSNRILMGIENGSTLSGSGQIISRTEDALIRFRNGVQRIEPGNSIGTLTAGSSDVDINFSAGGSNIFQFEISGDQTDKIEVYGDIFVGNLSVEVVNIGTGNLVPGTYPVIEILNPIFDEFFPENRISGATERITGGNLSNTTLVNIPPTITIEFELTNDATILNLIIDVTDDATSGFDAYVEGLGLLGADASPDADPDMDGVDNTGEYVGGSLANDANSVPFVQYVEVDDGGLIYPGIQFDRRTDDLNASAQALTDSDLSTGPDFSNAGIVETNTGPGAIADVERVTARTGTTIAADDEQFLQVEYMLEE
ncbi:MAG: beta strand repeat-containing protein [Opitutales bacterium]